MTLQDAAEMGLFVFLGVAGGLYVGGYLVLGMAGQFVDETLREIRTLAFELLANKTVQALIQAADKIPNLGKGGGLLDRLVKGAGRMLGFG